MIKIDDNRVSNDWYTIIIIFAFYRITFYLYHDKDKINFVCNGNFFIKLYIFIRL